jgi:hypothetical protein
MFVPGLHWVFFEHDPEIGRTVWLGYDDEGNPRGAHVEQEVDPILAANAEAEKLTHGQRFGDWNHAASVPLTFLEKTGLGEAIDARDKRYISKILNDADYRGFRTSRGRV